MELPANFRDLSRPGTLLWVREGLDLPEGDQKWRDAGRELLDQHSQQLNVGGRGDVRLLEFKVRSGVWRRNLHGGLLGGILGSRFISADRLTEEVYLSESLRANGVMTPEVLLAYAYRRSGFWHQHLVTAEVPDAVTVFSARQQVPALKAAHQLLDKLFHLGFWAPDLHPGNLLWQQQQQQVWVIDLADACLLGRPLTLVERKAREVRYLRFFRKHGGKVPTEA